jgi:putative transposase
MESNNIGLLPTQYKLKNKPKQVESQKHRHECTNNFTKKCPKNVCLLHRDHNISKATLYNWKSKYSGMDVSQVHRLKELEEENRKLKQMYADLALDNKILKDVIEKKL